MIIDPKKSSSNIIHISKLYFINLFSQFENVKICDVKCNKKCEINIYLKMM